MGSILKRNVAVALAAVVLAVGVGLGAVAISRAASAAPAPLPVAYNGADGWHQGRARLPVIYLGESNVFVRTPHWSAWSGSSARASGKTWVRLRYRHGGQRDYVFRWAVLPGATIPGWNGGPSA